VPPHTAQRGMPAPGRRVSGLRHPLVRALALHGVIPTRYRMGSHLGSPLAPGRPVLTAERLSTLEGQWPMSAQTPHRTRCCSTHYTPPSLRCQLIHLSPDDSDIPSGVGHPNGPSPTHLVEFGQPRANAWVSRIAAAKSSMTTVSVTIPGGRGQGPRQREPRRWPRLGFERSDSRTGACSARCPGFRMPSERVGCRRPVGANLVRVGEGDLAGARYGIRRGGSR
jgi:hypothetical protein